MSSPPCCINHFQTTINPFFTQSSAILLPINNILTRIAAIYSPPRHNLNLQNYADYFSTLTHNCITGGDYNAKHSNWGCRTNKPRGTLQFYKSKKLQ